MEEKKASREKESYLKNGPTSLCNTPSNLIVLNDNHIMLFELLALHHVEI
jgi:hypothetical protein